MKKACLLCIITALMLRFCLSVACAETGGSLVIAWPAAAAPAAAPIVIAVPETPSPEPGTVVLTFATVAPAPTAEPTAAPTAVPTAEPTAAPTAVPTAEPTAEPSAPSVPVQGASNLDAVFASGALGLVKADVLSEYGLQGVDASPYFTVSEDVGLDYSLLVAAADGEDTDALLAELGHEEMRVMGISPDGKTILLAGSQTGYALTDGVLKVLLPSLSRGVENKYDNLQKSVMTYLKAFPGAEGVVWSPNSRYAVMPNYERAMVHAQFVYDPIVLDVQTGEFVLLDTYPSQMKDGAVMSHACFSSDSRYLFAMLYGKGYTGRVTMMRYDLERGEKQVIYSSDHFVGRPGIFEMNDGSVIGLTDSMDRSEPFGLMKYTPSESGYYLKKVLTGFEQRMISGAALEYSAESGVALIRANCAQQYPIALLIGEEQNGFEGIKTAYAVESLTAAQLSQIDPGEIASLDRDAAQAWAAQYANVTCARLSPDGRYALLNCVKDGEGALLMLDVKTKELRPVAAPEGYAAAQIGTALGMAFAPGIVWNKDGTVLMLTDGVCAYRFE